MVEEGFTSFRNCSGIVPLLRAVLQKRNVMAGWIWNSLSKCVGRMCVQIVKHWLLHHKQRHMFKYLISTKCFGLVIHYCFLQLNILNNQINPEELQHMELILCLIGHKPIRPRPPRGGWYLHLWKWTNKWQQDILVAFKLQCAQDLVETSSYLFYFILIL